MYDARARKILNERFRKIKKVYQAEKKSTIYRNIETNVQTKPNSSRDARIFKYNDAGVLQLISKSEYNKLNTRDKEYYDQRVSEILNNPNSTSTKLGWEAAEKNSRASLERGQFGQENSSIQELTDEEYDKFWKDAATYVSPNKVVGSSDELQALLMNYDIGAITRDDKVAEALNLIRMHDTASLRAYRIKRSFSK